MSIALLLAYATVSLHFGAYSLYRLATDRRRERWIGAADLLLLGVVGVLSSLAWPLLLPVYGAGWLLSREDHRPLAQIRLPRLPTSGSVAAWGRWRSFKHSV